MNLSKLLIEKNKEIETERRKNVSEFLNKEMDIERLKKDIIDFFTNHISKINLQCKSLTADFTLHLKKNELATLFQDNSEFKKYISSDIESILNLSGMGTFKVSKLDTSEYYDPFYKDIEIKFTLELLNEDF